MKLKFTLHLWVNFVDYRFILIIELLFMLLDNQSTT